MLSGINNTETEADVWGASRVLSGRSLVSNLGCTELFVIEHGVKINDSAYWRDVLLTGDAISNLVHVGDFVIFQQVGAHAHRARDAIEFLRCETTDFIGPELWPANSPDL